MDKVIVVGPGEGETVGSGGSGSHIKVDIHPPP